MNFQENIIVKQATEKFEQYILKLSGVFCFLFGLLCLAYVQGAGDGVWHFYAELYLDGFKLYSQLELVQQPVFILVNALGITLFGASFLGEKLIYVFILTAYVYVACRIVNRTKLNALSKSILLIAFFFTGIYFEAFRFDDYHAFENLLILTISLLILNYYDECKNYSSITICIGSLIALAILTRVNDGLVVLIAATLILLIKNRQRILLHYFLLLLSMTLVMGAIFFWIGEWPNTWADVTIFHAVAAKGGGGSALLAPLKLVKNSYNYLFLNKILFAITALVEVLILLTACIFIEKIRNWRTRVFTISLIITAHYCFSTMIFGSSIIIYYTAFSVLCGSVFAICCIKPWAKQFMGDVNFNTRKDALMLMPMALFASGAVSSGGYHYGLYFPFALCLLMMFFSFEQMKYKQAFSLFILIVLLPVITNAFWYRLNNPYSWHDYHSAALTEKRKIVPNDGLGTILIDKQLNTFITPICKIVKGSGNSLLSLPFSYANYICGIAPWHNYVQTFFDTSTKSTIEKLVLKIQDSPPTFILYQRQLQNLARHEMVFNSGRRLPHRDLDDFIMKKLSDGVWMVCQENNFGAESTWLLIKTNLSNCQ